MSSTLHVLDDLVEPHGAVLAGGAAVTIGNFDGVHRGHRALLAAAAADGRAEGLPTVALTFEPHPATVFGGAEPAAYRLTPEAEKGALLREAGADVVIVARFSREFATLRPDAFVAQLLMERLHARLLHVGWDFNFGAGRTGTSDSLAALAAPFGVRTTVHPAVSDGAAPISSTRIREALRAGDVGAASSLLGRVVAAEGDVAAGHGRGHALAAPTLNLYPQGDRLWPRVGVYATRARIGDTWIQAVSNLGVRPTFADDPRLSLETHVLEPLPASAPGPALRVEFVRFIRPEQRFADANALAAQIQADCATARAIHAER